MFTTRNRPNLDLCFILSKIKLNDYHQKMFLGVVSDQVRHKSVCTATAASWRLEILDFKTAGIVLSRHADQPAILNELIYI